MLRGTLAGSPAELVFFQHDEVLVHCPAEQVEPVAEAVTAAGGDGHPAAVRRDAGAVPARVAAVECYADAK